ncbi:MAG: serine hydrolase [Sylvanvirus sp.]|uniref:Serine hydrolase n=1 Tax=Sylvanvirus sp. TaxID=2487774 RepID=A0A3G5AKZ9_9VIRU|nr:MAG: serine hydrolase [Sylvanvirus sp.]
MSSTKTVNRSIRILCVHGAASNSDRLRKSMNTLIQAGHKYNISFEFVDSPFEYKEDNIPVQIDKCNMSNLSNPLNPSSVVSEVRRKWWSFPVNPAIDRFSIREYDTGKESLDFLLDVWNKSKYDGILGFSQGSALVQMLLFLFSNNEPSFQYIPSFALLCNTFEVTSDLFKWSNPSLNKVCPVLCISGEKDALTMAEKSELAVQLVFSPDILTCFRHKGKHHVPQHPKSVEEVLNFILANI